LQVRTSVANSILRWRGRGSRREGWSGVGGGGGGAASKAGGGGGGRGGRGAGGSGGALEPGPLRARNRGPSAPGPQSRARGPPCPPPPDRGSPQGGTEEASPSWARGKRPSSGRDHKTEMSGNGWIAAAQAAQGRRACPVPIAAWVPAAITRSAMKTTCSSTDRASDLVLLMAVDRRCRRPGRRRGRPHRLRL